MSANLQTGQFYGVTQKRVDAAGLVLTEIRHAVGRKLPLHTHESAYFGLLLDGGYTERFNARETGYGPFTLGFHPPSLTHEDEIAPCGSRMFCIEVRDTFWQRTKDLVTKPKFTPDLCGRETTWLGLKLYRSFRASTLNALQMEEICSEMLARCARVNLSDEKSAPEWLRRTVDLLHGTFRQQTSLDAIARELNLHPIHLSRVFRKKHGCTMGEYVNRLRVQFACAKMSQGWPALDELALEAGFADQSHMGRVFKSVVGDTPAKFREFLHDAVRTSAQIISN
jgi:AraC family transcriptional regulator